MRHLLPADAMMPLLRPSARPRASADLGYRMFAGLVAAGFVELLGINLARDRNPDHPNYLTPTLVAAAVGVVVAIVDPPDPSPWDVLIDNPPPRPPPSGDGWLAPDGTFTPAPYGHAQGAADMVGEGLEPTEEELRCCGVEVGEPVYDDDGNEIEDEDEAERVWRATWPLGCLAEARLTQTMGYQRVQGRFSGGIGFELFSQPTARQIAFLKRHSSGPNLHKPLDVEIGDTCSEEGHGHQFSAPGGLVWHRHKAIDEAVEKLAAGDYGDG